MPSVKKMIYLEPSQATVLKRLSTEENASETEIVRRALVRYAHDRLRDPLDEFIGAFGGPKDGAVNHDRYLLEGPRDA